MPGATTINPCHLVMIKYEQEIGSRRAGKIRRNRRWWCSHHHRDGVMRGEDGCMGWGQADRCGGGEG